MAALGRQGVGEAIVVECDRAPCARADVEAAGARYVFVERPEGFHKARAMNVGASLAARALILWCDADLLAEPAFTAAAIAELDARGLDLLVPWTSIAYLDESGSRAAMAGDAAAVTTTLRTVASRHGDRGGVMLVRASFLARFGGICEEFVGWGGEDAAFFHKAALLGRAGVTRQSRQHLRHLFHPAAGALDPTAARGGNPHHAANLALLAAIRATGSRERFLARFPPPSHRTPPWYGVRRLACRPEAEALGTALLALFGPAITLCGADEPADAVLPALPPPDLGGLLALAARLATTETDTMDQTPKGFAAPAPLRLNLGCSDAAVAGFVNVDRVALPTVDQQVDLAQPWPWPDGSVAEIRAWDVIEHLPDKILTMNEIWRVLQQGGQAEIVVPTTDGPGAFQDPTHVSFWHRRSFLYYEAGNPYRERFATSYGIQAAFRVVRERIQSTMDGPKLTIVLQAIKQ